MGKKGFILLMLLVSLLVFSSTVSAKSKTQTENGNQNKNAAGIRKESKNTIDVLVAGDSLSYSSVSPLGLWNQYGITSYVCGQPGQMLSETYKQRVGLAQAILGFPEIIILDVKYSIF